VNPYIDGLNPYPFERLAALKAGLEGAPDKSHIAWSIGEPQHPPPAFLTEVLNAQLGSFGRYPPTRGTPGLRTAVSDWATRRFGLKPGLLDPERMVLPVSGTREALFAFTQCMVDSRERPLVAMPNPCYQIYEGAALLAGAEPYYLNTTGATAFLPDLDAVPAAVWQRCTLITICNPGNPTGAIMPREQLFRLLELADRHDFVIVGDECYSEIYLDEQHPPPGLLEVCAELGRDDFRRCLVFNSLSKRSNLAGLRSGFVAGDPALVGAFAKYRSYHGCAPGLAVQAVSEATWRDEDHVIANRALYRDKIAAVLEILEPVLDLPRPEGGFFLWPRVPIDDAEFVRRLFVEQHVTVLPGSYLARDTATGNPGRNRVRMALVASREECIAAAERIREFVARL
jgi:N-succinyldiaminopimelate aminotransferase